MVVQRGRKIAEGREAEIFEYGEGWVLKLFRDDRLGSSIEREATAMRTVRTAGGAVPDVGGVVRVDDRPGLIVERVDGPDMLALLGKKPWFTFSCGRMLGEVHAALHDAFAPPELPSLKDRFRRHIGELAADAPERAALAEYVLGELDALPDGDRICHGDFHPGNVLVSPEGPRVIDWPNAMRGDPHADVARMLLVFDIATVPPGAPSLVRRLQGLARRYIRSRYIASYKRVRPLDEELLARWRVPVAAQRLREGLQDERQKLLSILDEAFVAARELIR